MTEMINPFIFVKQSDCSEHNLRKACQETVFQEGFDLYVLNKQ